MSMSKLLRRLREYQLIMIMCLKLKKKLPKIHTSIPNIQKNIPVIQRVVSNTGFSLPKIRTSIPNMKRPIKHPPAINIFAKLVERCVTKETPIQVNFDDDIGLQLFHIYFTRGFPMSDFND